ncbi:MAG: carbon-nitrogen hydrolase [Acidobacteria bacterium]|nr:carbon-nitrogen hydrolase [Acidobacteriota bacterium]MBI3656259.1 carbon-nitrogen hydrolase [Acidobacteriota bacterium]
MVNVVRLKSQQKVIGRAQEGEKHAVRIALVQMRCGSDSAENLRRALFHIETAVKRGAEIVCLPELFLGPYFCQKMEDTRAFARAEPIPGPTTARLSEVARTHRIVLIGGSLFEQSTRRRFYNSAPIFGTDGALLGVHRKVHIPEDLLFHEQRYFAPGNTGIKVFTTPFGKIAVLICFDQWFPEAARLATLQGAEIIFYPTAIGKIDERVEENITGDWQAMWRNVQLGHSAANNVYVAAVNRVGREGSLTFWGGSFVADPSSQVLAVAGDKEQIVIADCDFGRVKQMQAAWGFLRNRRPDTYKRLLKS